MKCFEIAICNINISSKTIFEKNFAKFRGGAIFWIYSPPSVNFQEVSFTDNYAELYGPNLASQPVMMEVTFNNESFTRVFSKYGIKENILSNHTAKSFNFTEVPSGQTFLNEINIYLLDFYGQITRGLNDSRIGLVYNLTNTTNNFQTTIPSLMKSENGVFIVKDVEFIYTPGSNFTAMLKSDSISTLPGIMENY